MNETKYITDEESSHRRADEKKVLDAVRGIAYGSVEITIHDGRIVQVERTEKIRFQ